jgi:N-carbamoylputrescine amidase
MPRTVRVAVCSTPLRVPDGSDAEKHAHNLDIAEDLIVRAKEQQADIACLPEVFHVKGISRAGKAQNWFEDVPGGPTFKRMSHVAQRYGINVVAPILAIEAGERRNLAMVFDRTGRYLGGYQKVHLTEVESDEWGIVPGRDWPVFDLDFGKIGITICYDVNFPEGFRVLALQGAEIIFHPTVYGMYGEVGWEAVITSRAIDNCVYVCPVNNGIDGDAPWMPGMCLNRSSVIGPDGIFLADLGRYWGTAVAEIDLDRPRIVRSMGASGEANFREKMWEHRRPETYKKLTEHGYWVENGYPRDTAAEVPIMDKE